MGFFFVVVEYFFFSGGVKIFFSEFEGWNFLYRDRGVEFFFRD